MLHQVKPVAPKSETSRRNLYDRNVPVARDGIVTLRLAHGAPGVTFPVEVTHEEMHDLRAKPGRWSALEVNMLVAYAKLYPPAK